ncbi:MAG TPA: flagellar hook-length control protein FliK [Clostridia bacterium]|nr:flagellar hook-length control protein FliK [Clostridia bacterium]
MRIDASSLLSIKAELTEQLKNLDVGDALKGMVLEALGNSIAIRTASGQIFTALLQEGANIPKGAFVELIVSSITGGKIYAEFKTESKATDLDAKVSELLKQINLPVDEKNIEAAKLLIKYKLPLNKEAIVNITGLQKSIDNLNQSSEGRVGLLLSGLDIKNTTVDVLNKVVLKWSPDLIKQEAVVGDEIKLSNAPAGNIEVKEISKETEQPVNIKVSQALAEEEINSESPVSVKEPIKKEPAGDLNVRKPVQEVGAPIEDNRGTELLEVLEKLGIEAGGEVKRFAGQVSDILASIKNSDMEALTYLVSKEIEITPKNLGMLMKNIENSDGISQFIDKLQQRIIVEDNPELREIKESIKKVFLEPRQVENSKEVAEQLKDIVKLGEKLENYLDSRGNKDPEIRDALSNLRDNIDFIRSINENNNFIQIPLMINSDTSTAKLYIFNEGKNCKKINPDNATILIALDLKSLGHLESMIGVKGKAVNVTFRVENKSVGDIIEKQSLLLKNSLEGKGYSLSPVRIISLEQPFSLLSLEAMINESGSGKIHFDMRI